MATVRALIGDRCSPYKMMMRERQTYIAAVRKTGAMVSMMRYLFERSALLVRKSMIGKLGCFLHKESIVVERVVVQLQPAHISSNFHPEP